MTEEGQFALNLAASLCVGILVFGFWDEATRHRPYMVVHRRILVGVLALFAVFLLGGIWL